MFTVVLIIYELCEVTLSIIQNVNLAVKPRLTSAPSYRSVTSSSVIIQFRQFDKNNGDEGVGPVTKYQIQIKKKWGQDNRWTIKYTTDHDDSVTYRDVLLTGLQYNTLYSIRVMAVYNDGNGEVPGEPSPTVNIKTNCRGRSYNLFVFYNGLQYITSASCPVLHKKSKK